MRGIAVNTSTTKTSTLRVVSTIAALLIAGIVIYAYGKVILITLCAFAALLLFGAMSGSKRAAPAKLDPNDTVAEFQRRGGPLPSVYLSAHRASGIDR